MAFGQPSCSKGLYIGTGNTAERKRSGKERRKVMEVRGKAKVGRKEAMENVVQNVARGYRGCCCLLLLMKCRLYCQTQQLRTLLHVGCFDSFVTALTTDDHQHLSSKIAFVHCLQHTYGLYTSATMGYSIAVCSS